MADTELDYATVSRDLASPLPAGLPAVRFRLATHEDHPRRARLRFLPGGVIELGLAARFPAWTSGPHLAGRLVAMRAFFAKLFAIYPDLRGACWLWLGDVPERPGLAFSGSHIWNVLIPDPEFVSSDAYADLRRECVAAWTPFAERERRAFWRGTVSGDPQHLLTSWRSFPRARLCLLPANFGPERILDCRITRGSVQVSGDDTIAEMRDTGVLAETVPLMHFADFMGAIDIDGNSSAWKGLFTKFLMGCVVIKIDSPQGHRQWYYDRLVPWVNFIPAASDLSDVEAAAAWMLAYPDRAAAIAARGRALAASITLDAAVLEVGPRVAAYIAASHSQDCV